MANSRQKGARGERDFIAALQQAAGKTLDLKRNLEQTREGGFDITGLDNWAPEIKRYKEVTPALLSGWWEQAVSQSTERRRPVLAYRADRRDWRVVLMGSDVTNMLTGDSIEHTVELSIGGFVQVLKARGDV